MSGLRDSQTALVVSLVSGSHVVNHMYFMLLPPVTGAAAMDVGTSQANVFLAIGVLGVVVTGLQLPFGHLSDTRGRSLLLAISLFFGALGAILTATAQTFTWLLFSQVVLGIGIAAHHPAHYPLLSAATDPAARGRAFSVHGFTGAIGYATPPAIVAGAVTIGFDWRWAIGAIAVTGGIYAIVAVPLMARAVDNEITGPPDTSRADVSWSASRVATLPRRALRGLRGVLAARGILLLTILWFISSIGAWGIKTQTLPVLTSTYGLGESVGNLIVSGMLVLGAFSMFGGGWLSDRSSPGLVLLAGYVALVGLTLLLASGAMPVVLAIGFALLLAATIDYSRPARASLADRLSEDDTIGKNFGLLTIGISGGAAVAPPVLGYITSTSGVRGAFLVMAGFGVLSLVLTLLVIKRGEGGPVPGPRPTDD